MGGAVPTEERAAAVAMLSRTQVERRLLDGVEWGEAG